MRKFKGVLLAGMLVLSVSVPVYADKSAVVKVEAPADTTDYYMTVDSGGVGVDIYPSTDGKGEKLNDKTVKDGTVLHIEGETEKNGETWGYTEYNGRYGYVPLEELRPSKDAELAAAGIAGSTEKESSAVEPSGTATTDTTTAEPSGTATTGTTTADPTITDQTGNTVTDPAATVDPDSAKNTSDGTAGQEISTSDNNTDEAATASSSQNSTTGEIQGPPAATDSASASQASNGEVQGPPAADGTTESEDSAEEEAVTKPVNGTVATSFKEENPWYKSPFIWIGIVTVLAVIGILGYHWKKR